MTVLEFLAAAALVALISTLLSFIHSGFAYSVTRKRKITPRA